MRTNRQLIFTFAITFLLLCNSVFGFSQRSEINLNGTWEIAKTQLNSNFPTNFSSKIPVPGLVDMAVPAIDTVTSFTENNHKMLDSIKKNESVYYNNVIYWYKRKFIIDNQSAENVILKINKAMYHTKVFVNGNFAGENYYSFSPTWIDIKPFLNKSTESNELVISVGCRNNLPDTVLKGDDVEKFFFIPGIYDDVKLIVTGSTFISNVQIAPDIEKNQVRVVAEIKQADSNQPFNLKYIIREAVSRRVISFGETKQYKSIADFKISIPDCKLWSPESPFMYELELSTASDNSITRFGMRSFCSGNNGVALLNGKPYYMRGTNVCIFRFFEDSKRENLPWDAKWVNDLHKSFKDMHWNSYRACIGFPPERWYEIADSLGFLVQDEYPIWKGAKRKLDGLTTSMIANEYRAWMRERWNHPCVVIWDAQNESVTDSTAIAINKVRELDLSNRPWDNGWSAPANNSDVMESHTYLLYPTYAALKKGEKVEFKNGLLNFLFKEEKRAEGPNFKDSTVIRKNPIIMNEYSWLWLNRDGSTCGLTDLIYKNLFPEANTADKRLEIYAKLLGIETEYWRSIRKLAGVMNFCALTFSRPNPPRGLTCDNFADVKSLRYNPYFYQYVRPAFSPVGIMIDFWDEKASPEKELNIPVNLINDTYENWNGTLKLTLTSSDKVYSSKSVNVIAKSLGKLVSTFTITTPSLKGIYKLISEICYKGECVKSIREIKID